jgi:FkbM family methyltransferase
MTRPSSAQRYAQIEACLRLAANVASVNLIGSRAYHVGAHHGEEDGMYRSLGVDPVYIEPSPAAFAALRLACPGRTCVQAAADCEDGGFVELRLTHPDEASSLLSVIDAEAAKIKANWHVGTVRVPRRTLDSIVAEVDAEPTLIALDVQGAEMRVLEGAERALLEARVLWVEVWNRALYAGTALRKDVVRYLADRGFVSVCDLPGSSAFWGEEFFARRDLP